MADLNLVVLIENSSPDGLLREHGLSVYLEYRGCPVLLDAGESGAFLRNAADLGVDLSQVAYAALSHGHYDHADGLTAFFVANRTAQAYARPRIADAETSGGAYIGVNPGLLHRHSRRFDLGDGPRELIPGLHLLPDTVPHEQSLVAETAQGLVILNSCCHAGAGHIVQDVKAQFPGQPVRALVGGFHLMGRDGPKSLGVAPGIVKNLAHWLLEELEVGELYTGHCTGRPAFTLLAESYPDRVHALTTGLTLTF